MAEKNDFDIEYDDDAAVKFILNSLPQEVKEKVSEDTIDYFLDILYEYYEEKGTFEEDLQKEVEIDEDEMTDYLVKAAQKESNTLLTEDEIRFIVQGEIGYCDSIGLFEEDE